ncbi:MAG: purine-nucleoside phosphorylase [bacterium]
MNTGTIIKSAEAVRAAFPAFHPKLVLVMGSGWREVVDGFTVKHSLDYADIPVLGAPQVAGHGGQLLLAEQGGVELLIFAGRRHWYEGVGWEPIAFPVCLAKTMGAQGMVLTNSAGGINARFRAGAVMVIDDHLNLMGTNPLIGQHHSFWGPRFPDMTGVYDADYRRRLDEAGKRAGVSLEHGIYMAVTGPSYETPAEISAFRRLGADAVGMSTVPEAILARAAGLKVAGLSCITNAAAGMGQALSHEEVLAGAKAAIPGLTRLLKEFVNEYRN